MISHHRTCTSVLVITLAAGLAIPALAQGVRQAQEGQASYITGGIGHDEQLAMEQAAPNYNLQVTSSEPGGAYVAGLTFMIRDRDGREVLQARNAGPLFYAQLPPGSYVVEATYNGSEQRRDVSVGSGHASDLHLVWPGNDQR